MKRKHKRADPRQLLLPFPQENIIHKSFELPPAPITQLLVQKLIDLKITLDQKTPKPTAIPKPVCYQGYFPWPTTDAPIGDGKIPKPNWPKIGLLHHVGYVVGEKGELQSRRQAILARLFELANIPKLVSPAYIAEWGNPRSAARLKKMAYSIAAFCRQSKRRQRAIMRRAIENYQDDLAWLKSKYYDGKFDNKFHWPRS
jgi:hypothetical protein